MFLCIGKIFEIIIFDKIDKSAKRYIWKNLIVELLHLINNFISI